MAYQPVVFQTSSLLSATHILTLINLSAYNINEVKEMACNNDPIELAVLADALAVVFATGKTADENNIIGNFLVAVGSIILTIAAAQAAEENKNNGGSSSK